MDLNFVWAEFSLDPATHHQSGCGSHHIFNYKSLNESKHLSKQVDNIKIMLQECENVGNMKIMLQDSKNVGNIKIMLQDSKIFGNIKIMLQDSYGPWTSEQF